MSAKSTMKRKAATLSANTSTDGPSNKARKTPKGKKKAEVIDHEWPTYFEDLFKVFKALNTVLAFITARKHLAVSFPVVRSSVERLLNRPLELAQVAELKTLLPDVISFGYIPRDQFLINSEAPQQSASSGAKRTSRCSSPDFSITSRKEQLASDLSDMDEEHILVLDFISKGNGKKTENPATSYMLPPALSPKAVKKLIETRNARFMQAVTELLHITPSSEDPVDVLKLAAREHIPINPRSDEDNVETRTPPEIPEAQDRQTIDAIIEEVKSSEKYMDQIVERKVYPAKEGQIGRLDTPLSEPIQRALLDWRGINSLYTHQAAAINALQRGNNVIVSTSTASGKSIIYQVPLMQCLEEDRSSTAMFIYPTKALAQDQRSALEELLHCHSSLQHIRVATFDGDTSKDIRSTVRECSSVIFTNFDMLHVTILPQEEHWRKFMKSLKLVVIDELHYYSNLMGSHVAQIVRRLRRICCAVGNNNVLFISCSATIAKPLQHMQKITGVENIEVVTEDGAPSGRKDFLLWNPPLKDAEEPALGRHNSLTESVKLMIFLMKRGVRAILFCKIRRSCELAMKTLRAELSKDGRIDILERVVAYRGGYSQQDRRRIEGRAFSGELLGIVATNALELGVDIGVLDAVIMMGFPMSIASFRQQSGRAGRRARDALAVMVADAFPIDQHYLQFPEELFEGIPDELVVDVDSKVILSAHLQCAAHEMPLNKDDAAFFGQNFKEICDTQLVKDDDGWYHTHPKFLPYPSKHIAIRGPLEERYTLWDITNLDRPQGVARMLEELEMSRALFELYEGGIFIHQGLTYLIQNVSHDSKIASLVRSAVSWITKPRDFTNVDAVQTLRIREIRDTHVRAYYGRVNVTTKVFGFFKIRNNVILDRVDLDTPPYLRETTGMWIDLPANILDILRFYGVHAAEAIHAAEHAFLNRFAMQADLRTECKVAQKEYAAEESSRKRPARLIFYDKSGQEAHISARAFDHVSEIVHDTRIRVETCPCDQGCHRCILSKFCREDNEVTSKLGAQIVLRGILDLQIHLDDLPEGNQALPFPETIVPAEVVQVAQGVNIEPYDAEQSLT